MYQIYLFAGLYGFFGSILIVLFKILPVVLGRKFFPDSDEKTFIEAQKTYDFYSTLWSFRLIGTGFLITIINALFPSSFIGSVFNPFFVIIDISLLSIASMYGIVRVYDLVIDYKNTLILPIILGFPIILIYAIIFSLNFTNMGPRLFLVDNILTSSTIISQLIFTVLYFFYFIEKNRNF
jgi:hypothetical protein